MTLPTPRKPFTHVTFEGLNPSFLVQGRDDNLESAWAWTLHLRVPEEYGTHDGSAADYHTEVVARTTLAHSWLSTGDRTIPAGVGGDSFTGWCEPLGYGGDDDRPALHLYFAAPDAELARLIAVGTRTLLGLEPYEMGLSTALDWAEQTEIPT